MIPDCISFNVIPHTTKLFRDYLSYAPAIRKFYPTQPDAAHVAAFSKSVQRDPARQAAVADALERQNRAWGASEATLHNIQKLRNGAFAVVTGQQVGLFGGPLLSLLKAASALSMAQQLETLGLECVPVFWMATEDHDLAEVNKALLLTQEFQQAPFTTPTSGTEEAPVAAIRFAEGTNDQVAQAAALLGDSVAADYLRDSYREGETFSNAFARLYAHIFGEHGLILLDPNDAELHRIATPLFLDAMRRVAELDDALLARNKELQAEHYHEQVKVTAESTPLFALVEGVRVPIHRANGGFKIGRDTFTSEELLARIEAHPEAFNANVLLRPVLQDYWLPTLGYFGGPAEIAYFAQLGVVYERLLGRITPVLSRLSASLIEPRITKLLDKYDVQLTQLFHGEYELRDCLAAASLPPELNREFDAARGAVQQAISRVTASLQKLDPTLVDAAGLASSKMQYQVIRLQKRAAAAELRRTEILSRHASQIENSLYPHKTLQEREVAGIYFFAKYGPPLIDRLVELAEARCPEHKVLQITT